MITVEIFVVENPFLSAEIAQEIVHHPMKIKSEFPRNVKQNHINLFQISSRTEEK